MIKTRKLLGWKVVGMEKLLYVLGVQYNENVITNLLAYGINAYLAFARIFSPQSADRHCHIQP